MGFSALDSESKLWRLIFLHLMTFLVTLTFDFVLSLEMSGCLEPLAYILATTKMKTCNHCIFGAWTFYIGFNDHVPDEYFPDAIKKNQLYLNHTISMLWWYAKLCYSSSSSFRVICNKPFHKIRQQTVASQTLHVGLKQNITSGTQTYKKVLATFLCYTCQWEFYKI